MDETIIEAPEDKLELYRQQVAAEKNESHGKMSDTAREKLRAMKEQERIGDIDAERFQNALKSVVPTPENLERLVSNTRLSTPILDYAGKKVQTASLVSRMAAKLAWWISAGYELGREIDSVGLINSFSEITLDEYRMTDKQFDAWSAVSAKKRLKSRIERGLIKLESDKPDEPRLAKERPCKSGQKCIWAKRRKAAPAVGRSEYCTPVCQQADRARQKRASGMMPTAPESQLCSLAPA
jgi:hypothetical protein